MGSAASDEEASEETLFAMRNRESSAPPPRSRPEADLQPEFKMLQRSPAKPPFAALAKQGGSRMVAVRTKPPFVASF